MTNYDGIRRMDPARLAQILDQVYLAGLNNGMYCARQEDDDLLDQDPFDEDWLTAPAEEVVLPEGQEEEFLLRALVEAILRNAGLLS